MTYGVPVDDLPANDDGCLTKSNSRWWYEALKAKDELEQAGGPDIQLLIPGKKDVLFGRGDPIQKHPGNQEFRRILLETYMEYQSMGRKQKTAHTWTIVERVLSNGGRFLKQHKCGFWIAVEKRDARQKVSNTYADIKGKDVKKGGIREPKPLAVGDSKRQGVDLHSLSPLSASVRPEEHGQCFDLFQLYD